MDDEIIQPEILIPPNITLPPDIESLFRRTKRKIYSNNLGEDGEREIHYRKGIKYVNGIPERESYLWYAPEYSGGLYPSEEDRILRATPTIVEGTIPHPKKPGQSLKVGYIESLTGPSGSNIQRIHYKLLEAIRSGEYDIIVAPEYSYCTPGYEEILSKEDIDRYVGELCDANKGDTLVIPGSFIWKDDRYSIHNSSPVIVGNKIIEIHDKMLQAGYDKDIVNHEYNKITIQINELQDKILELRGIRDRLQTTGGNEGEISEIETQILMIESRIREIKFHKYRIVRTPTPELDTEIEKLEKTIQHLLEGNNPLKNVLLRRIFDQIESLKELREKAQFLSDDIEGELLQLYQILGEYRDIIESYRISGFDTSNFEILAQNIGKKINELVAKRIRILSRLHTQVHEFEKGSKECTFLWREMMVGLEICIDAGILSQKGCRKLDIGILVSCSGRKLESTMCALKKGGSGILIDGVHTSATGAVTREENQDLFSVGKQWKTTIIRPNQLHPWLPLEIGGTVDSDYHEKPEKPYREVSISYY